MSNDDPLPKLILLLVILFTLIGVHIIKAEKSEVNLNDMFLSAEDMYQVRETTGIVTAYSEIDSCHHLNCAMASGNRAYVGAIACPRNLPLYTRIIINYTTYICEDRTAEKYDGRYDIFYGYGEDSHKRALEYGIKNQLIQIIL